VRLTHLPIVYILVLDGIQSTLLEFCKEYMSEPTPFEEYMLKKGQSRGASKSMFSFGASKEDESGEATTEKIMGKFKGVICIDSAKEKADFEEEKSELMHKLKMKLNTLCVKKTGKPLEFNMEKLDTLEGRNKF
jgi:hypothetical protein